MQALTTPADGGTRVRPAAVSEPEPRPDQAVVEVRAVSVNRGDLSLLGMLPPGSRLGFDVAGTVVRAAADGSGPASGTRVAGVAERDGWSERVALSTTRLAPVPDGVEWTDAAALPVAGLTALYAMRHAGSLLGRRVLVTGASGGVGRIAVQLARAAGAEVAAWAGSAERTKGLAELGAADVSTYDAGPEATRPVHVLVDSVGGEVFRSAFQLVEPRGVVVCYGNTTRADLSLPFDWGHARPGVRIRYLHLFDEMPRRPVGNDLAMLLRLVADGALDPHVTLVGDWADPEPTLRGVGDRQVNGKAVLVL
ncbi:oxidoreductase [Streptomyces longisporoflavus]|uniref:zinc-binding dehydrogenase n=1 Tax=Streptomyces longisporoflavus TaxID=28044 RepID=UPI0019CAFF43|nr:zinc-binding dehydrogenase [Streptomyces longisporoflavus]GGV64899.1 oxidoreductase [Streptomyces longisporoflavus]